MDIVEQTFTEALEEDMAAFEADPPAPAPTAADIYAAAGEHCQALARNKAGLAELHDRCDRDVADLFGEREREEQEHLQRLARIDGEIEAVRAYERKESEMWERYIAAARRSVMELLA